MTDPIVDAVCAKLQSRSAVGLKKYGTTLADNAATVKEKLAHIQEELMDAANYVEWLLQEKEMPTPMTIEMTEELEPDEIYIQLGENRIGTEICLRRWQKTPFEGGIKYTRAQPRYKRVNLDAEILQTWKLGHNKFQDGYNTAIADIKAKYGDLYAEVKDD